jgi:hypothetical protein
MVLKERERDLDLFDRSQTLLHLQSQVAQSNQLPAHSAGNFQLQPTVPQAMMPAIRTPGRVRSTGMRVLLRKKINVKRVNC